MIDSDDDYSFSSSEEEVTVSVKPKEKKETKPKTKEPKMTKGGAIDKRSIQSSISIKKAQLARKAKIEEMKKLPPNSDEEDEILILKKGKKKVGKLNYAIGEKPNEPKPTDNPFLHYPQFPQTIIKETKSKSQDNDFMKEFYEMKMKQQRADEKIEHLKNKLQKQKQKEKMVEDHKTEEKKNISDNKAVTMKDLQMNALIERINKR